MNQIHTKPPISLVVGQIGMNGVYFVYQQLAAELNVLGYAVELVTQGFSGSIEQSSFPQCQIVCLGYCSPKQFFVRLVRHFWGKEYYGLIASGWPYSILATLASKVCNPRTRVITVEHVDWRTNIIASGEFTAKDVFLITTLGWFFYRLSDVNVGVSKGVVKGLCDKLRLSSRETAVIYNPVRTFSEQPVPLCVKNEIDSFWDGNVFKLLFVGRLAKQKDLKTLLYAVRLLPFKEKVRLILAGDGGERKSLQNEVIELELDKQVLLIGEIENPSYLYQQADLFVLSSISEGFANVLVEALSFGLPIVSTNCLSGPAEILEDGKWGCLVPIQDPQAFADSIVLELQNPRDKQALIQRSSDFSSSKVAHQYLDLLQLSTNLTNAK